MNNESGSALQKANFALLILVACALAYLIVRERVRSQNAAAASQEVADASPVATKSSSPVSPTETRSSFAPLRPRVETNTVRVIKSETIVLPRNSTNPIGQSRTDSTPALTTVATTVADSGSYYVPDVGSASGRQLVSVVGRVFLRGEPPAEKQVQLDALCGRLHPDPMFTRHFVVGREAGLANVFVYVKAGAAADSSKQSSVPLLDNVGCEFKPYILGVRAGQPFSIRNSDPVLHNMHAMTSPSGGNREFNIGMPTANMTQTKVFNKPEVFIKMKCDVHPWMFAYLGVVDHPWFAVTDNNGNFALPAGLPKGRYTVAAVHVKAGESTQELNISEGGPPPLNFTLDVPPTLAQQR